MGHTNIPYVIMWSFKATKLSLLFPVSNSKKIIWLKLKGKLFSEMQGASIAMRLRDLADAIHTKVHGVVMVIKGFPVLH